MAERKKTKLVVERQNEGWVALIDQPDHDSTGKATSWLKGQIAANKVEASQGPFRIVRVTA